MKNNKRTKLPRGLRRKADSPYIWFSWRDCRGKQHQQSTGAADLEKAFLFRIRFLEKVNQDSPGCESRLPALDGLPLGQVSELFFKWKEASNASLTVARERRIFKPVLAFFGAGLRLKAITLGRIREYQQERRKQISPTMRRFVSARTVNYELQLLRGLMSYAGCWNADLATRYKPLRQVKSRVGKTATKEQLMKIITTAKNNDYWQLAMNCAALAVGTGCRSGELRNLRLQDICLDEGKIVIRGEVAKNRKEREPRLVALAEWGLRNLLLRAKALGAVEPHHYLLPLHIRKSRRLAKTTTQKWDVTRPMTTWVKSWRRLIKNCGMEGFRFHDLRHTFRTLGAEAGVPLEVMMAQLGHMDRETSLEYVHIQQRALERAKQLIESEQAEILAAALAEPEARDSAPKVANRPGRKLILESPAPHLRH